MPIFVVPFVRSFLASWPHAFTCASIHAMLRLSVCLASAAATDPTCAYILQRRGSRHLGPPKKLDFEVRNDTAFGPILAALPHSGVLYSCGEGCVDGDGGIAGGRALFGVAVTAAVRLLSSRPQRLSPRECRARALGRSGWEAALRWSWPPRPSSPREKATGGSLSFIHSLTLLSFLRSLPLNTNLLFARSCSAIRLPCLSARAV